MTTEIFQMPTAQNGVGNPKLIHASMLGALDVRFIGKDRTGWFAIEGKEIEDLKEMTMQVIAVIPIKCDDFYLFNDDFIKYDRFLEVLFIDGGNKICSLFLKTEGMGNFESVVKRMDLDGLFYPTQIIKATSASRAKDGKKFFVLEFEHVGPADAGVVKELAEMIEGASPYLYAASRFLNGRTKQIPRTAAATENESA